MKTISLVLAVVCSLVRADDLLQLSVTSMQPGYCFAGSRADERAFGGYGRSSNAPKELGDLRHGTDGAVSLVALPSDQVSFAGKNRGFKLLLINRSGAEAAFLASDSRIPIVCEAKADGGQWKEIEYLPWSFCGNSRHHVFLSKGFYWEFAAPAYAGGMKTKMRFKLRGAPLLYSNEFDGSISVTQFINPVPEPAPFFTVFGQVQRQGKYELPIAGDFTISQAIALTGGFAPQAQRNDVRVIRRLKDNPKPVEIHVNVKPILEGKQEENIAIHPLDVIIVREKKNVLGPPGQHEELKFVKWKDVEQDVQAAKAKGDITALHTNLIRYQTRNLFSPTQQQGLDALVTAPDTDPKPKRWIQFAKPELLIDPWEHKYQYRNPGKHNPSSYDVFSMGPDGIEGTADDIGNW